MQILRRECELQQSLYAEGTPPILTTQSVEQETSASPSGTKYQSCRSPSHVYNRRASGKNVALDRSVFPTSFHCVQTTDLYLPKWHTAKPYKAHPAFSPDRKRNQRKVDFGGPRERFGKSESELEEEASTNYTISSGH